MKNYKISVVTWHDAHADQTWACLDSFDDEPCVVVTVGMVVPNAKKDHITIVQSVNDHSVDNVIHIPKGMVVSVAKVAGVNSVLKK